MACFPTTFSHIRNNHHTCSRPRPHRSQLAAGGEVARTPAGRACCAEIHPLVRIRHRHLLSVREAGSGRSRERGAGSKEYWPWGPGSMPGPGLLPAPSSKLQAPGRAVHGRPDHAGLHGHEEFAAAVAAGLPCTAGPKKQGAGSREQGVGRRAVQQIADRPFLLPAPRSLLLRPRSPLPA